MYSKYKQVTDQNLPTEYIYSKRKTLNQIACWRTSIDKKEFCQKVVWLIIASNLIINKWKNSTNSC